MSCWVLVALADEIADRTSKTVEVNGTFISVFNLGGEYFALEDVCTHDGGELSGGWLEGDRVVCPRHLAEFSIRTGEALKPPAYEGVHRFPVRAHNGLIEVCDDRVGSGVVVRNEAS